MAGTSGRLLIQSIRGKATLFLRRETGTCGETVKLDRILERVGRNVNVVESDSRPIPSGRAADCERGDSNPHAFRHQILSLARLPIPPLSR